MPATIAPTTPRPTTTSPSRKTAWNANSRTATHWKDRQPDQPFFAVFNHEERHESQIRVPEARRISGIPRGFPFALPRSGRKRRCRPFTRTRRRCGDWARYYDNITVMDYQIGDRLKELEDAGLAASTRLSSSSATTAPGMPGVKKWIWEGASTPLVIRFPKKWQDLGAGDAGRGLRSDGELCDFAPTVLSLCGSRAAPGVYAGHGVPSAAGQPRRYVHAIRDRMAERFDIVRVVRDRDFQYHRNFMPHLTRSQFTSYTEEMPTMQVWRRAGRRRTAFRPAAAVLLRPSRWRSFTTIAATRITSITWPPIRATAASWSGCGPNVSTG